MTPKETESFYERIFTTLDEAIVVENAEGKVLLVNNKMCLLTGYSKTDWIGQEGISLIVADEWRKEYEHLRLNHPPDAACEFEGFFHKKNTSGFWGITKGIPFQNDQGDFEGRIITIKDITDNKKKLTELKENDERLRFLLEASTEGIVIHEKGIIIDVNDATLKMLGYSREELIGNSIFDFTPKYEHEKIRKTIRENLPSPVIREIINRTGNIVYVELTGKTIQFRENEIRVILMRDISELRVKRIEEQRLISLIEASPHYVAMMDNNGLRYINPAGRTLLGYEILEDILHLRIEDLMTPESNEFILNEAIPTAIEQGIWKGQAAFLTRHGKKIETAQIILAHLDENGKLDFLSSIAEDITEQLRAREILMESRERLRYFMQESREAILIHENGTIIDFNNEACKIFEYDPEDLTGKPIDMLYETAFRQEMKSLIKKRETFLEEFTGIKKDGTRFDIEVYSRRRQYKNKDVRVVGILDISQRKKAERALRSSEVQLNAAVEGTNVGIWDWNIVTNKVSFNDAWKAIYGYQNDDYPKYFDEWKSCVHPDDLPQLLAKLRKHLYRQSSMFHHIYRTKRVQGDYIVIEARGKLIRDENNMPVRILGTAVDITERQQMEDALRKSQAQLTALIENREEAIWSIDCDMRILNFNRPISEVFSRQYGVTMKQGKIITEGLPPDLATTWVERYDRSKKGESYNIVDRFDINGKELFVEFSLNPIRMGEGNIIGVSVLGRNITQQKYFEQSLREAKDTAEAANRTKSQFLANMSHEIRTPMNGIIGFTDLLLQTQPSDQQREYLDIVRYSADSLLQLINDLLDISKIESGQLELLNKSFNLNDLITEVIRSFQVKAEEQKIKLLLNMDNSIPEEIIGDDFRIRQVLINLIGNAMKFSKDADVIIRTKLKVMKSHHAIIGISVRDFGIGISQEKQKLIFEPFRQVDNHLTRKYGGTGLGLSIAKKLVKMMNGNIGVQSIPGKGSRFYFTVKVGINKRNKDTVNISEHVA
ncbi:MAG: PAS domain S-box protein [Chitinophagales bacterium]|nr:PAS domain S-box protein [Chitinophagales bacterium]